MDTEQEAILHFIGVAAGVLCRRSSVSPQPRERDFTKQSTLEHLITTKSEALLILSSRYGEERLGANLLNYCTRKHLDNFQEDILAWGEEIIQLGKLSFNRKFPLFKGKDCETWESYPGVLMYLAETIAASCKELAKIRANTDLFYPHALSNQSEKELCLDDQIGQALGFKELCRIPFPQHQQRRHRLSLVQLTQPVFDLVSMIAGHIQMVEGHRVNPAWKSKFVAASAKLQCDLLGEGNLIDWEAETIGFIANLKELGEVLKVIRVELKLMIKQHQGFLSKDPALLQRNERLQRSLQQELVHSGLSPLSALKASHKLFGFLDNHDLKPKEVLAGELSEIDPGLSESSLLSLQRSCLQEYNKQIANVEKSRILGRMNELKQVFQNMSST